MRPLNLVHGGFVLPGLLYLAEGGSDPERMLETVGLPASVLEAPERPLPHHLASDLLRRCARLYGDERFGLRALAPDRPVSTAMLPIRQVPAATAPVTVLGEFVMRANLTTSSRIALCKEGPLLWIDVHWSPGEARPEWGVEAYAYALLINGLRAVLGAGWQPAAIKVMARNSRRVARDLEFDCPVAANAATPSVAVDEADLVRRLADRPRHAVSPGPIDPQDLGTPGPAALRQSILVLLENGILSLAEMAERFDIGERSFRRRLGQHGLRYGKILEDYRIDQASRRLRSEAVSVTELAFDLGYDHPQNFSRAFRRHMGVSPTHFRDLVGAVNLADPRERVKDLS